MCLVIASWSFHCTQCNTTWNTGIRTHYVITALEKPNVAIVSRKEVHFYLANLPRRCSVPGSVGSLGNTIWECQIRAFLEGVDFDLQEASFAIMPNIIMTWCMMSTRILAFVSWLSEVTSWFKICSAIQSIREKSIKFLFFNVRLLCTFFVFNPSIISTLINFENPTLFATMRSCDFMQLICFKSHSKEKYWIEIVSLLWRYAMMKGLNAWIYSLDMFLAKLTMVFFVGNEWMNGNGNELNRIVCHLVFVNMNICCGPSYYSIGIG